MTKVAFLFPGQGSQKVGMGVELAAQEESQQFFESADHELGFELSKLMTEGPQEELTVTYNAQPALLTVGAMIADRLKQAGIQASFTAGHSLGEYTALYASEVLSFEDAVKTVHKRGLFMNEAMPAGEGAMAAILGLDLETLTEVTRQVTSEGNLVQPANLNCPGQVVISGTKAGVDEACVRLKEAGAKRALMLDVSGPFHSELMRPAAGKLGDVLESIKMNEAKVPVIANVTAQPVTESTEVKRLLIDQLSSPVRWEESVRQMLDLGVTQFIECGPSKVLSGLVRKIDRSATVWPVYDEETLNAVVEASKEWS
ncbi:[acyl-carrier-protein] S-malonyltransferase [Sporosarcina sp. BI001-red]|uniref:ACP S-malonyltransferase n=1 Tax=Sporosarcina sp. BI001-red TaxID=2282866 RepID=UPI000E21C73D|nr:ACP S-malonyltransferase [Sporosarcina sp. BI001-red]REB09723.1 [acyl-carrier-protein] S-malonyltransferase [Sporosarcina sp. BI001-red]